MICAETMQAFLGCSVRIEFRCCVLLLIDEVSVCLANRYTLSDDTMQSLIKVI